MTSVSITQDYKLITITEGTDQTTVVTAPAPAVTVEVLQVGPQGPQGTPGVSPLAPEVRIDTGTTQVIYVGQAVNGSTENSALWSITRTLYNSSGIRTAEGTATGVTWTGRAGHTYI